MSFRSYKFDMYWPATAYMIKQAAGVTKGGQYSGFEWVGAINMKQVKLIEVYSTQSLLI